MNLTRRNRLMATLSVAALAAWLSGCAATDSPGQRPAPPVAASVAGSPPEPEMAADALPSQSFDNLMRYADHAEQNGNLVMAAKLYGAAHDARPDELAPLYSLIVVHRTLNRPASAAIYYDRVLALDPDNLDMIVDYGMVLLGLNQPREARIQFNRALALEESPRLYNGIGVTYDMVGDHAAAQPHYQAALELNPTNLTARSNLGLSLALTGDHDRAIALLATAVADPNAKERHRRMLATAHALAGDLEQAKAIGGADFAPGSLKATMATVTGLSDPVADAANQP